MSSSRFLRQIVIGVFTATLLLSGPAALAVQRVDEPRDPVVRFVKYLKKVFSIITQDDLKPDPPHP